MILKKPPSDLTATKPTSDETALMGPCIILYRMDGCSLSFNEGSAIELISVKTFPSWIAFTRTSRTRQKGADLRSIIDAASGGFYIKRYTDSCQENATKDGGHGFTVLQSHVSLGGSKLGAGILVQVEYGDVSPC